MIFDKNNIFYPIYSLIICLTMGAFWWTASYHGLNMQEAVIQWSVFIFISSALFKSFFKGVNKKIMMSALSGLIAMVLIRIIFDMINDSSTHQLLVAELIIAMLVAVLSSGLGIVTAGLFVPEKKKDVLGKSEYDHIKRKDSQPKD